MTVGMLRVVLFIPGSNSLKDKMMVLHSLKPKLRNSFNIAVAQIDDEDKWQKTTLALVGVGENRNNMNSILSDIINFISGFKNLDLIKYEMELL
jgi:uncharacterized protein YlxP (DUF503 family)